MTRTRKQCKVENCADRIHGKGYCNKHYMKIYDELLRIKNKRSRKDPDITIFRVANELLDQHIKK